MANHNPNFKEYTWRPGESGNPNGRPAGSRDIRTKEVLESLAIDGKCPTIHPSSATPNGRAARLLPGGPSMRKQLIFRRLIIKIDVAACLRAVALIVCLPY
jgi:hypothetical protein